MRAVAGTGSGIFHRHIVLIEVAICKFVKNCTNIQQKKKHMKNALFFEAINTADSRQREPCQNEK